MQAEHVRKSVDELFVSGINPTPLELVITNLFLVEVAANAILYVVAVARNLQIETEEGFVAGGHVLLVLNVELSAQDTAEDVSHDTRLQDLLLVLLH